MARATGTDAAPNSTAPEGIAARMTGRAHEQGAKLALAARDARTIADMLDNHGRPQTARMLRRSGDGGERLGRSLSETDEPALRRTAAIAAAAGLGLLALRRLRR